MRNYIGMNSKGLFLNIALLLFVGVCQVLGGTPVKLELPSGGNGLVVTHTGFTLSYNKETNCPNWVAWDLTVNEAWANVAKRSNGFTGDPGIPPANRVEGYDYKDTGYDRGHMCPAADMKWSKGAMKDCFYMSNMCPQLPKLNRQWWEALEKACRQWTSEEGTLYICCGPVFYDKTTSKTIGNEVKVKVPDAFFKVVLSTKKGKEKAIGFIYRNTNDRQTMEETCVPVDSVEAITGYDFFPALDDKIENAVEKECKLSSWK